MKHWDIYHWELITQARAWKNDVCEQVKTQIWGVLHFSLSFLSSSAHKHDTHPDVQPLPNLFVDAIRQRFGSARFRVGGTSHQPKEVQIKMTNILNL